MDNAPLSLEYSVASLLEFLDFLAEKGLVNKNTVVSRKAACNKMLDILDSGEAADLRSIDLDEVAARFGNLRGTNYSPRSLQVYKSRVGTALADFFRYKENPANFKIIKQPPTRKASRLTRSAPKAKGHEQNGEAGTEPVKFYGGGTQTVNIPVPLRSNCVVQVNGLPVDLSKAEAQKLAAVIQAMVSVEGG